MVLVTDHCHFNNEILKRKVYMKKYLIIIRKHNKAYQINSVKKQNLINLRNNYSILEN